MEDEYDLDNSSLEAIVAKRQKFFDEASAQFTVPPTGTGVPNFIRAHNLERKNRYLMIAIGFGYGETPILQVISRLVREASLCVPRMNDERARRLNENVLDTISYIIDLEDPNSIWAKGNAVVPAPDDVA